MSRSSQPELNPRHRSFGMRTLLLLIAALASVLGAFRVGYNQGYTAAERMRISRIEAAEQARADQIVETRDYPVGDLNWIKSGRGKIEMLPALIKAKVDPPSWNSNGPGWVQEYKEERSLAITQTVANHRSIEQLLNSLP